MAGLVGLAWRSTSRATRKLRQSLLAPRRTDQPARRRRNNGAVYISRPRASSRLCTSELYKTDARLRHVIFVCDCGYTSDQLLIAEI